MQNWFFFPKCYGSHTISSQSWASWLGKSVYTWNIHQPDRIRIKWLYFTIDLHTKNKNGTGSYQITPKILVVPLVRLCFIPWLDHPTSDPSVLLMIIIVINKIWQYPFEMTNYISDFIFFLAICNLLRFFLLWNILW